MQPISYCPTFELLITFLCYNTFSEYSYTYILIYEFISLGEISRSGIVGYFLEFCQISLSRKIILRGCYKKMLFLYTFPKTVSIKFYNLCQFDR